MNAIPSWIHSLNRPSAESAMAATDPRSPPEIRLLACRSLILNGIVHRAVAYVEPLRAIPEVAARAEQLLALCRILWDFDLEKASREKGIALPRPEDRGTDNFWVVPAGSEKTLIVFTEQGARFWVSVYLMQRLLEDCGVNAIYVFDPFDAFYLGGIGGRWASLEATSGLLREVVDGLGSRQLYCLGQSSGGYAALRYGLDLDASGILALSPTIRQPYQQRHMESVQAKTGRSFVREEIDLRHLFASRSAVGRATPRTAIFCGEDNRTDMRSAAELADLPGVDRRPLPKIRAHAVMASMLMSGLFRPALSELLNT